MRMMRGCPATGRMCHNFDKATHQCRCGRWQAGYAPKKEPVRPRAECQICERTQALDGGGCLGHHGYRRPGWGFITGDCTGAGHKPYPETDALELYLIAVRGYITKCEKRLAELPALKEIEYHYTVYVKHQKEQRTKVIKKGDEYRYDSEERTTFPGFEDRIKVEMARMENEIAFAQKDEHRVTARIAKAKQS